MKTEDADRIEAQELTATQAVRIPGVTRRALNDIVTGKTGISAETGIRLEKVGWSTAETRLRLQGAYDFTRACKHQDRIRVEPREHHPA